LGEGSQKVVGRTSTIVRRGIAGEGNDIVINNLTNREIMSSSSVTSKILDNLDARQLGGKLKDARKARGLTQEAVALKLGILRTTLVVIEKGSGG
jgi:hypothetical protein